MGAWVSSTSWLQSPGDGGFASDENKSSFSFSLVPTAVGLQRHPTQSTHITHTHTHRFIMGPRSPRSEAVMN